MIGGVLGALAAAAVFATPAHAAPASQFLVPGSGFRVLAPGFVRGWGFQVDRSSFGAWPCCCEVSLRASIPRSNRERNQEPGTWHLQPRTEPGTRTGKREPATRNQKPPIRRPAPQRRIGVHAYLIAGATTLTADRTFEAVAGTRRRGALGGGGQVTGIWKDVFADVAVSQISLHGERVFVDNDRVFQLGIPLEITMRPVDISAGWRFRLLGGRLFPYAGGGLTYLRYRETSEFAASGEDVSEGKTGAVILGGADVHVWRWVSAGAELRWRRVRGILGEDGSSREFGDDDAGGLNTALRISVGF
jgi:hypothetical protein